MWDKNVGDWPVTCAHLDSARRFLSAAGRAGETGPPVSALTASDVTAFLAGMARVQAPGTTQNTASMLRTFLTWLYAEGVIAAPLAGTVPGAYRRRRIRMPAIVTGAEAAALLAACDRTTAQGLRDYAIVLILTRMGLRAGEIAALTLGDVDWRSGIAVISGKGGRRDQLPLPRDVAEAVIAYLRDGRPAAALDRRLFVRSVAPHRGLTGYGVGHAVPGPPAMPGWTGCGPISSAISPRRRCRQPASFRLVPLHPTALAAIAGYWHRRDQAFPGRAAPAVLVSSTGDRLTLQRRPQGLHPPGRRGRARAQDRAVPPYHPRAEALLRGEHAGRLVPRRR